MPRATESWEMGEMNTLRCYDAPELREVIGGTVGVPHYHHATMVVDGIVYDLKLGLTPRLAWLCRHAQSVRLLSFCGLVDQHEATFHGDLWRVYDITYFCPRLLWVMLEVLESPLSRIDQALGES
ncbi:MAG: hypothetical protein JSS66_06180 [Armatimonadetes bacterium]|nr:hypothetical protein [Armatimonadota bacterium]